MTRSLWQAAPLGPHHRHGLGPDDAARRFDVCIVGSGAGGAVAAERLVRAGLEVLMIEEGGRVGPEVGNAELDEASPTARAREADGRWGERGWPWTTRNLGGGTVWYGGASFRYRPFDFDPTEALPGEGLDVRWPFDLDALRPFYAEVEERLGVCGGPPDAGREPVRAGHPLSLPAEHVWSAAQRLGYAPFRTPLAINREPHGGRPACDRCSPCIAHQCASGARADVVRVLLEPLVRGEGFSLRTGIRALALDEDPSGAIDRLHVLEPATGRRIELRARAFVLAANAIQTAALLLRSRTARAPHGVGNERDLVGRGLCMKLSEYVRGELDVDADARARHPVGQQGPFSTMALLDHYLDPECPTGVGGLVYEAKPDDPAELAHAVVARVETILADRPRADNRVRLADERDEHGVPRVIIDYRPDPLDLARLRHMIDRCRALLREAGARSIRTEASGFARGSCHLHGTCRAGHDPRRSVVDPWARVHSTANVFVADGSFMPYPGGVNPTLTIQACALRAADAIARGWPLTRGAPT